MQASMMKLVLGVLVVNLLVDPVLVNSFSAASHWLGTQIRVFGWMVVWLLLNNRELTIAVAAILVAIVINRNSSPSWSKSTGLRRY